MESQLSRLPRAKCLVHVGRKFHSPRTKIGQSLRPTLIEIVFILKKAPATVLQRDNKVHQFRAVAVSLFTGEQFVTGKVSDTGEVWLPVYFGHRWRLVTSEVHRWSLVNGEVWSPVKFDHWCTLVTGEVTGEVGYRRCHRWSWSPARSPVKLVTGVVTGEVGRRRGHQWSWSPAWSPVKFDQWRCWWEGRARPR